MHFFGVLGTLMFFIGFLATIYLGTDKLYHVFNHIPARLITQRPLFYIALTTMILGSMMFLAGFIGELVLRNSPVRIVPAAGSTNRDVWLHQCGRGLAAQLGKELVEFPGGHGAFSSHPRGFALKLDQTLRAG